MNPARSTTHEGNETRRASPRISGRDGTHLHVQDWGRGRPVLFVSAWALSADFWGTHMMALGRAGFRTVAFDRRGHGRSDVPSAGYDSDTLADDLAAVIEGHDLEDLVIIAHSMGAGEVVRYVSRHGAGRIGRLVLVAPTTPYLVRTADNPDAVPEEMLDGLLQQVAENFPKWVQDNEEPFFVAETDLQTRAWIKAMMLSVPLPVAIGFRRDSGRTDFRPDLRQISLPTLILHGDRDASAPLPLTGARTAEMIRGSHLQILPGRAALSAADASGQVPG
ncbi:MAG: alpha/beta fold hydrolase [Steroidobacteraceae bacterium]